MKCMVLFCKNKENIPGITYFSLTSGRHDSWMRALGRDPPVEHLCRQNSVCSEHFIQEDTFIVKNKLRLKVGAVPRLKLGIKGSFLPTHQHNRDEERISKRMPSSSTLEEDKENMLCTIVTSSPTHILESPKSTNTTDEVLISYYQAEEKT